MCREGETSTAISARTRVNETRRRFPERRNENGFSERHRQWRILKRHLNYWLQFRFAIPNNIAAKLARLRRSPIFYLRKKITRQVSRNNFLRDGVFRRRYVRPGLLETHISSNILAGGCTTGVRTCVRHVSACAPTRTRARGDVSVQQQFTTSLLCGARTEAESLLRGL